MYEHLEVWRGDPVGEGWLDELPGLVRDCADRWALDLGEPWIDGVASLTMPAVRRDDLKRLVLKVQLPDREGLHEDDALRRWDGDGAVRLIDHDPERRACYSSGVSRARRCRASLPMKPSARSSGCCPVYGSLQAHRSARWPTRRPT